MFDIALKVPLGSFALGGRTEGDYAADSRIQAVGDAFDAASLTGAVAAFEEHRDAEALRSDPLLEFDQFDLEAAQFFGVIAIHPEAQRPHQDGTGRNRLRAAFLLDCWFEFGDFTHRLRCPDPYIGGFAKNLHLIFKAALHTSDIAHWALTLLFVAF